MRSVSLLWGDQTRHNTTSGIMILEQAEKRSKSSEKTHHQTLALAI